MSVLSDLAIQTEPLKHCEQQLDDLLHGYWDSTPAQEGMPPLDVDWEMFREQEQAGRLVIITARSRMLLGFAMYIVGRHPKHKTLLAAFCDTLATDVHVRRQGIGTKLVCAAESLLKPMGVEIMIHGFRSVYNDQPLFPRLGFKLIETFFMKRL